MISRKSSRLCGVVCGGLLLGSANGLNAAIASLAPVADTTLFQTDPDNNLGGDPTFISGTTASGFTNRALIKFDIAGQIPSNALIQAVTLNLSVTRTSAGQSNLFRLHPMQGNWVEGTGKSTNPGSVGGKTGAPALAGEPTWQARAFPNTLWTTAGAAPGIDYLTKTSATQLVGGIGHYAFSSSNLLVDARNWQTNASRNFGWILICDDESIAATSRRIGSREDPLNPPRLDVQYLSPPTIQKAELVGGAFQLTFQTETNLAYFLQAREMLSDGAWLTFTNFPPAAAGRTNVVAVPAAGSQQFFRVGAQ